MRPATSEVGGMPRYIVERVFPEGFEIPLGQAGVELCRGVVGVNEDLGVTWLHSYVRDDRRSTYCVYDAPGPESIRRAAERNGLPVERIARVMVLDPYFYTPSPDGDDTA
jgi:hypothetical protein